VRRLAFLARVAISDSEASEICVQLNHIFAMIEKMQAVDTQNIEPMAHGQEVMLRSRDDVVTERDQHELFQSLAPQVENDFYLVPKVID